MKEKSKFQEVLDRFETVVRIEDGSQPDFEGDVPQKQNIYFGCNYKDIPTVIINWSEKGRGFGQYVFQIIDGKMICDNECDPKEAVKRILCTMVDQCEFTDPIKKNSIELKEILDNFNKLDEKREDAIWEGLLKLSDKESEQITIKEFLLKVWPEWESWIHIDKDEV